MSFNNKGVYSIYTYIVFSAIILIITSISSGAIMLNHFGIESLGKTKSFYAAESGIEDGLLEFKQNPDITTFEGKDLMLSESKRRITEYKEQKIYKKELIIKEFIEAGKTIQLPFRKSELDNRITKFHIAYLLPDTTTQKLTDGDCNIPQFDTSLEISLFQKAQIISYNPLDYMVDLNSNWNGCYLGNNTSGKSSLVEFNQSFSNENITLVGDKCILNNKGHAMAGAFEEKIPYIVDTYGDSDPDNNQCKIDCMSGSCSEYYTYDNRIFSEVQNGYQQYYTIAPNFIYTDMSDEGLIVLNIRAIDDDAQVVVWATDDTGVAYEIPGRYINFSTLGSVQGADLADGLFTRLKIRKKINTDLLPIFDFSLYSESELIK